MTDVVLTTQSKIKWYIYLVSGAFMGVSGAEAIGRDIPSIPVLVIMGMLFFPFLEFIFWVVGLGTTSGEVDNKSLVFKYPHMLIVLSLCFVLIGWVMINGGNPQNAKDLRSAFVGGMMLGIAIDLIRSWVKMRKTGTSHERYDPR
ncbi:hypothetical protein [Sphingorhabdus sp.]|uniref:hypothetical protein n=1 Tax=Sphingorhabdus sp. TaxID=1902408 RepID=UPI0039839819